MNLVVNLNKPRGITSHTAVSRIRRMFDLRKAGHAGTLDPVSTGVLLICTGEATKVTRFISDLDKEYVAQMKLGAKTDTYDCEGCIVEEVRDFSVERRDIEQCLERFTGTIEQTPPMYSAIKVNGKPLYKLARKGVEVARPKRMVTIKEIELIGFDPPFAELRVSCSKGTYIRSLCNDIGDALGVGAHMVALQRTRVGDFRVEDSASLEELERLALLPRSASGTPAGFFYTVDKALNHMKEIAVTEQEAVMVRHGHPLKCTEANLLPNEYVKLKIENRDVIAIGKAWDNEIRVERVLHL